jgi:hypothetical protein
VATHSLVCPFLTDDPTFAYGVEFGLLHARMSMEEAIADYFCRENQDRILLLANRLNWSVREIEAVDKDWFWCKMEKTPLQGLADM